MALQSPLHESAQSAGAVFTEEAGWRMPAHFGAAVAEYQAARTGAVLFDLSHRGKIEVRGRDAVTWLHNLCTNDIRNLPPQGCEAFLTNHKAKAVAYLYVNRAPWGADVPGTAADTALLLDLDPGVAERVASHLNRYIISEDVEIADRTTEFALLRLAGVQAPSILDSAAAKLKSLTIDVGPGFASQGFRRDALALPGIDLYYPAAVAPLVWDALLDAGARSAGLEAHELLRVEAGLPVFGKDIDEERFVVEVNRIPQSICYTKGCYLGQEPIVMARDRGHVNRKLMGIVVDRQQTLPAGTKLTANAADAGQMTSSIVSPRLGKALALAYVKRGHETPGTVLELEVAGVKQSANVVSLPV